MTSGISTLNLAAFQTPTNVPIEQAVGMAMQQISDDSTQDLRNIVQKVNENMANKAKVRQAQAKLAAYESAVSNHNKDGNVDTLKQDLLKYLSSKDGLGLDPSSSEYQAAAGMPDTGAHNIDFTKQDDVNNALSGSIKQFETTLDGIGQSYSDLGQKLQFELQQANDIYTRANKMQSDILAKYDQTASAIAQNFKG